MLTSGVRAADAAAAHKESNTHTHSLSLRAENTYFIQQPRRRDSHLNTRCQPRLQLLEKKKKKMHITLHSYLVFV
jgi:hypothetical protein